MHIQRLEERRLKVHGEDAREWLNGQLTCDLREPAPGSATYGLILSSKGKLISDVWVLEHPEVGDEQHFSLSLPSLRADAAFERLDRFLVMEDVDVSFGDEALVSAQGRGARALLNDQLGSAETIWPTTRLDTEGAEVWLPANEATALVADLGGATNKTAFHDARVEAGIPALSQDMGDSTLPQEVGLHGAVSFNKGCYVGQEPVIMLEHRGKPPKRLVRLRVANASVGDPILSGEKNVGRVTSVHSSKPLALALVKRKHLEDSLSIEGIAVSELTIIDDGKPRDRTPG
ncbi:MAG: folate-binding protein YgfZ [Polyangiales bacterium]